MRDAHPPDRRFSTSSSVSLPQSPSPIELTEFCLALLVLIIDGALFAYGWNSAASFAVKQNCIFSVSNLGHNKPAHCRWLRMQTQDRLLFSQLPMPYNDRSLFSNKHFERVHFYKRVNQITMLTAQNHSRNRNPALKMTIYAMCSTYHVLWQSIGYAVPRNLPPQVTFPGSLSSTDMPKPQEENRASIRSVVYLNPRGKQTDLRRK